ncbi:MAG: glycosyltransferase family 9 protein [Endomicrobium sp.]|jgi:ADP-heptose:LPS heptosyltransferase|nr:glycosyltransferase family 9 protein [Endomicrobium sp.]
MKILIIKPSSFGDIVQAAPCASALKKAYPQCSISWVVFCGWETLLELFSDVDDIISWDRRSGVKGFFDVLKKVRKTQYDLILDLQGLFRSGLLAKLAKGKVKIGAPGMKELSGFMIKEVYPGKAKINATLRNLETVNFITGQKFKPQVNISVAEDSVQRALNLLKDNGIDGDYIVLLPFARGKGKDWSVENYSVLAGLIKEKYKNTAIAVLGTQKDYGKIKSDKTVDLCGKTDIKLLAALLSKSALAIGADTGSMHLASVLNVPSIFIFGASDINETAPFIGRFSLFVNKENPKNINDISPEEIFAEVQKRIK